MTRVNTNGDAVEETELFVGFSHTDDERDKAICLLLDHLGLEVVRTNATKHGTTEIVLRKEAI
jgi:hypothetical protein